VERWRGLTRGELRHPAIEADAIIQFTVGSRRSRAHAGDVGCAAHLPGDATVLGSAPGPGADRVSAALPPLAGAPVECDGCGLLQRQAALEPGQSARCGRCGGSLYHEKTNSIERALALTLAALVLLVVANTQPFLTFEFKGRSQSNFILTGIVQLFREGYGPLAALICFTSVLAPLLHLSGMLCVLVPIRLGFRPRYLGLLFRMLGKLRPWSMLEVYLLGVFVAVVKLGELATIEYGVAFWAYAGLILASAASYAALDARLVWRAAPLPRTAAGGRAVGPEIAFACPCCALRSRASETASGASPRCPRCGERLHQRKLDPIARTWALVIAAAILYIPANVYPVLRIEILGKSEADTILGGVQDLLTAGMWEIAALVFFASIAVPLLKLAGLSFLLISVQRRSRWRPRDRTLLYRVIEYIGRWSMIDMFMTSILVALVQLGAVATIDPGVGATCFASVVVITMFAARCFDPRLIWDRMEAKT
jgi:paraquat-inducible protein A